MKDVRSERETAVRGLMKELAVFTYFVESRHELRETMRGGPERDGRLGPRILQHRPAFIYLNRTGRSDLYFETHSWDQLHTFIHVIMFLKIAALDSTGL